MTWQMNSTPILVDEPEHIGYGRSSFFTKSHSQS